MLGTAALVGVTVPFWVPRLLSAFPSFRVERVGVVGTRYVGPDDVVRLAAISPEASVWDDPAEWERRVEAHPLIRRARAHRRGMRELEIRVLEDRPVALAATPALVAVNAEGRVLPLDPVEAALDLPLLRGAVAVGEDGRLADPGAVRLAALLERLEAHDPAFVQKVSEIGLLPGGAVEVRMLDPALPGRVLLPVREPVRSLRRVELALGHATLAAAVPGGSNPSRSGRSVTGEPAAERTRVALADARFEGQVVLREVGRR